VSKEDSMRRLLLSLMHELGTGRALDNARREHEEVARTLAVIDALVGRLPEAQPVAPVAARVEERVAA
jgi:hypothetical protein